MEKIGSIVGVHIVLTIIQFFCILARLYLCLEFGVPCWDT